MTTTLRDRLQPAMGSAYAIERELGRGGMATVYLARDLRHKRRVAIKVLHPDLAASLGPERFAREIEIAARLTHPHILPLHDSGEGAGLLYYVMPFIEGESLRERLSRERRLPVEEAVRIAREVSGALDYAHAQGIVHRDIKPENILLAGHREAHALVADFGLARAISEVDGAHLTHTGLAVGTPTYVSPEQASGERDVDGRSDIYSLGCVLYEMLAGEAPFTGRTAQAVIAKRFAPRPPRVRSARAEVPEPVDDAVARAMALEPADRFATAGDFARALAGQGVAAAAHFTPLPSPTPTEPRGASGASIAVLPFANVSADPENEYFSDGVTDEIISALSGLGALRLASRTSSFAFKGATEDVRAIGERLGVGHVLEGSVRRAGPRLRVTAQLVDVGSGFQLWAGRYDRQVEDVFAIQDEIARNITGALRVVLSEQDRRAMARVPTADVEAYDYFLRGLQYFHRARRQDVVFARELFERAIAVDPRYARAHAGIAYCSYILRAHHGGGEEDTRQAEESSRRALELEPELAEARTARGLALSLQERFAEAGVEFETAIRLSPGLFEAYYFYARAEFARGNFEKAAELFAHAARVRPEDFQARHLLAMTYAALGRPEEAAKQYRSTLEVVERHLELHPDDVRAIYLGAGALARLGDTARAVEWSERALALGPDEASILYNVACTFAIIGDVERSLDCLDLAWKWRRIYREWMAHDPDFDAIREHPRFRRILEG